jgi:hypothetical protein
MKVANQIPKAVRQRDRTRFFLGGAQMFVASFAIVLLIWSGVNRVSLSAAVVASVLTTLSVLLYRK